jgi:hypothetical protein
MRFEFIEWSEPVNPSAASYLQVVECTVVCVSGWPWRRRRQYARVRRVGGGMWRYPDDGPVEDSLWPAIDAAAVETDRVRRAAMAPARWRERPEQPTALPVARLIDRSAPSGSEREEYSTRLTRLPAMSKTGPDTAIADRRAMPQNFGTTREVALNYIGAVDAGDWGTTEFQLTDLFSPEELRAAADGVSAPVQIAAEICTENTNGAHAVRVRVRRVGALMLQAGPYR